MPTKKPRSTPKRPSSARKTPGPHTLESLHARLSKVERDLLSMQEGGGGDQRPLLFTMHADNAPKIVQLTLEDTSEEIVLTRFNPSKASKPRASDKQINVGIVSFLDAPQQSATIDVTNVAPNSSPIITTATDDSSVVDATTITTSW